MKRNNRSSNFIFYFYISYSSDQVNTLSCKKIGWTLYVCGELKKFHQFPFLILRRRRVKREGINEKWKIDQRETRKCSRIRKSFSFYQTTDESWKINFWILPFSICMNSNLLNSIRKQNQSGFLLKYGLPIFGASLKFFNNSSNGPFSKSLIGNCNSFFFSFDF